jgi:predicted HicB family RNase H-like nuclease
MSNLISCIECDNNLSQKANACPKCQTKRFKGVECKACNGILKGSDAISVLIQDNRIKAKNFDGEVGNFRDNIIYLDKWIEELHPFDKYCVYSDGTGVGSYDDRRDDYRKQYIVGSEVCTFHKKCFDSITNLKKEGEVIVVECISCSSKIRFEPYVSSIDYQNCKVCGEPNITANAIAEKKQQKNYLL